MESEAIHNQEFWLCSWTRMVSLIQVCWVYEFILLIFCDCYFLNIPVSSWQFQFRTEWMQRCTNYTGGIPQGQSVVQNALWFPCAAEPTQSNLWSETNAVLKHTFSGTSWSENSMYKKKDYPPNENKWPRDAVDLARPSILNVKKKKS